MTRITTLIVDDEELSRKKMTRYLMADSRIELIGEADDGPSAIEIINASRPEILLLDIQMPGMSGFDVLRMLPEQYHPAVIFVTAHDSYALKAFEVSAVDYLLKPYGEQRLGEALDKVIANHSTSNPLSQNNVQRVLDNIELPEYAHFLPVHHMKRVRLLIVDDISHIISEHRLVNVYDKNSNKFWTNETLQSLEKRLDPSQFFRTHRNSIINLDGDFEIEPWENGRLRLHYPKGFILMVANEPAKRLRELLQF